MAFKKSLWSFLIPLILILTVFCLSVSASAPSVYDFYGYTGSDISTRDRLAYGFNYTAGDCRLRMRTSNTLTAGSTFDSAITWYSPESNIIGTSTLEDLVNTTCKLYGSTSLQSIARNNTYYQSRYVWTDSAYSGRVMTEDFYSCTNAQEWTNFTTHGNVGNNCIYSGTTVLADVRAILLADILANYTICGDLTNYGFTATCSVAQAVASGGCTKQFIYPINSSGGLVNLQIYDMQFTSTSSSNPSRANVDLLDITSGETYVVSTENLGACTTCSFTDVTYEGTFADDHQMVLVVTYYSQVGAGYTATYTAPRIEYQIYSYHGDYLCDEWSSCQDGSQYRVCTDQNDIAPDRSETRTCELVVVENATFGFEVSTTTLATICKSDWTVLTGFFGIFNANRCFHNPANISTERPVNWTVFNDFAGSPAFNRHFMDFTTEWATEGTRSLKMWTIPPKDNEIIAIGGSLYCLNTTDSEFPEISNTFSNSTLSIGYNVTFPATNMRLFFDATKCDAPVIQNDAKTTVNITWGEIPLVQDTVCPKQCYASSCDVEPNGVVAFDLQNADTGVSLLGSPQYYTLSSNRTADRISIDLSGLGIVPGTNYTIVFATAEQYPDQTTGNCIMLDNVRYDVLSEPLLSITDGNCVSGCYGSGNVDYYYATRLSNGGCLFSVIEYAPACLSGDVADARENYENYCQDTSSLIIYNIYTRLWEEQNCQYGCEDGHCLTQEEYEADDEETDNVNAINSVELLFALAFNLLSPMFLYFILIMAVGIIVARISKAENGAVLGLTAMAFMTFMGAIIVIPGTTSTIIPTWIAIAMIVIESLIIAQLLNKLTGLGGG